MKLLSKEEFKNIINTIEDIFTFQEEFNALLWKHDTFGYLGFPTCVDELIKVLSLMFNDDSEWINYFVYELECGKTYEAGDVTREDGSNIALATADDLYDFLLDNMLDNALKNMKNT